MHGSWQIILVGHPNEATIINQSFSTYSIKFRQVLKAAGPAARLADMQSDTVRDYKAINELKGFVQAFSN
jgi:hypothetical protein